MIIITLCFVNHFDVREMHVFNFLSFKVVVLIVKATAFQKTKNFYRLGSFNRCFSICKSFLDRTKINILVPLQKLASYIDYKTIVGFDCALITVSVRGFI